MPKMTDLERSNNMSDIPSPITRKDQYLSYLTGNTDYYPTDPITREEKYLYYLCVNGIGGDSGGTTNYNDLQNKPSINGVTLEGNKTSADLNIQSQTTQTDHGTADTTFTLPPNQYHTWGEVAALTLTFGSGTDGQANGYWFSFDSGDTATTLSLPETIKTDIVVEPNMHYECSIVGNYMTFEEWEVSA